MKGETRSMEESTFKIIQDSSNEYSELLQECKNVGEVIEDIKTLATEEDKDEYIYYTGS